VARAVLTRDPVDAEAYAAALRPLGVEVVAMPVTKPAPAADPGALARALATGPFAAILVASPRAAHELARAVADIAFAAGGAGELWAVGPATKRALEIAKLRAHHPDVKDGAELARALVAQRGVAGKRVLVPRAEEGRIEALEILRAAGAEVVDVIAYRTVAVGADDPNVARGAEVLRAGDARLCAVFAPSQVTALAAIVGPLPALATRFVAIGTTTAAALRGAGVAEVAVAATPTPEGIVGAVRGLLV
jgi:uroporphyrinogen-III synthase